jgi:alpha-beta hydrolase superfamily lysophospholipase
MAMTTKATSRRYFTSWRWLAIPLAIAAICFFACGGQPLEPWHTTRLKSEFTAKKVDEVANFEDYLLLEERLFQELQEEVVAETPTGPEFALVRYSSGSLSDPATRNPDYNRSFELVADDPVGGVLLLHGLTDSPYSVRALGRKLNEQGFWVVGLRLPGHGTVPAALKHTRWQDMAAATRLGMQRLVDKVGTKPIHIAGYSNGAALALNYSLDALTDLELQSPASLILISPAIGISRAAALAGPTAALGRLPGLSRVGWTQTTTEFDPYKYNSFPVNAGAQVHRLTRSVASRIAAMARAGDGDRMPPILAFKSTVDATVSTGAIVDRLLKRLPDNGNELVLFDINRSAVNAILLVSDPGPLTERLMNDPALPFALTLVTNASPDSTAMVARYKPPFSGDVDRETALDRNWPRGIISLSHIALPFAPDDPLYGQSRPQQKGQLYLGQVEIRGERGLMKLSSDWLLRLRYNPFYDFMEDKITDWVTYEE